MPISNAYIYDFPLSGLSPTSGALATGAASASVTLQPGIETLILVATANCHFRLSVGASTALATDPLIAVQQGPVVVKLSPTLTYTLSAIQDTAAGSLSYCRVYEA